MHLRAHGQRRYSVSLLLAKQTSLVEATAPPINHPRVLLVEPNAALRSAIVDVLMAEDYVVERCDSLEQVVGRAHGDDGEVVLIAWQSMQGLLAEEHRHSLSELTRRLRLVLMVPRRWARMLDASELGVAGMISKPFDADELLDGLRRASLCALAHDDAQT